MAPQSSTLAWRIPGMGEPGGLPSMGSHRVGHDWSDLAAAAAARSCSIVSDSLRPHGPSPARLLYPRGFSKQEYWSGLPCPPPGDLSNPGIKPRSPALQEDSLPSELPEKPKNTGVGSLSLLQGIFPTQELNWISCIAGGLSTSWATKEAPQII